MKTILITGAAGFIGFHLSARLICEGFIVTGLDNINNYYDPQLKKLRLKELSDLNSSQGGNFTFHKLDLADNIKVADFFRDNYFDVVINLAAQAGVRYSIDNPMVYADANLTGFLNILEGCRFAKPQHLIFASSSSVYGMNNKVPFSVSDNTNYPISLYAATKKSNEVMAHAYSHLYQIPITGLRFFTVYGPFGRPDMAYFKFTKSILEGQMIEVFNNGKMQRDFTYIDDIIEGIFKLIPKIPKEQSSKDSNAVARFKIYNIGNNSPVELDQFIGAIEKATGKIARKINLPMQQGDVPITFADIDELIFDIGFRPKTNIEDGIKKFVDWYLPFADKIK
ncbi:NAD-dependent epimerase/dehydratase family protein [Gammaproteobacteria bacterium]|jgi:UDP-glucuronate 4-epimerase|nr:NAD-dependent epimerase/dehydratase family protein [Gammaproteobacteria bacterium]